jgi:hypothetical protein
VFSESLRERLAAGKYTDWAVTLTEDHMEALLWMVGEYGYRAFLFRTALQGQAGNLHQEHAGFVRLQVALDTIARIVEGERLDVEEAKGRIRTAIAKGTPDGGSRAGPVNA